ncbi:hypothetical protein [Paenibacillus lutrae]|uniref:Uncharacterized protein n=1 Tax=Paenibacillus lutrae TaxID=2078573 RepID=A0A7X3FIM4_9BACL|nr:hypothetical protein [Paenibacillus lutrae]MVP00395.1 hypothetical protein [Paenibacillus lutrae]
MKIRNLVYLIISIIVLALTISLTSSLLLAYFQAGKDWVGAMIGAAGNIIGGIIGGYIAYFVARYQIEESGRNQILNEKKEVASLSLILKEEIKNNSLILASINSSEQVDGHLLKYDLSKEAWNYFSIKAAHKLDEALFISLNTVYRKVQIYQGLTVEELEKEIKLEQINTLKFQFDDCIRKLEIFTKEKL